ncbi:Catsper1 [Symbiodinium natans]|uniref:Catsper1 protein n=1 Tax=Symbiodinium natans TaxID=878477 RepID=A0A812N7I9_9DINO|nr:Catsper1 [Symbiodinium natans]
MSELRLMVKGLVAGIRTLLLAFSLLFAVIYVISGFTFMMIGNNTKTADFKMQHYFETLPLTMFTAFRCFIGECIDDLGQPIPSLLAQAYGVPFILGYVSSYMLVALGIFNVILAVYVDITMKAAKESEAVTAEQHFHESIRVARTTRELLKKFAAAYRLWHDMEEENMSHIDITSSAVLFTDEEIQDNITITKELFLLVIQDQDVQKLMDDLDMPADRANMFEIIDADGSGTLHITELVQGLLKIRGEVNKGDTVASLLATKAVQRMIMELRQSFVEQLEAVKGEVLVLSGRVEEIRYAKPPRFLPGPDLLHLSCGNAPKPVAKKKAISVPRRPELSAIGASMQPEAPSEGDVSPP